MSQNPPPAGPVAPPPGYKPPGTGSGGGFDWNPVSWITGAADWTASEVDSAVTWAGSAVIKAAGWTTAQMAKVGGAVAKFVSQGIHAVEDLALRTIGLIHHMVSDLFVLVHHALGLAQGAVGFIHNIGHWGDGLIHDAAGWIDTHVVQPAIHTAMATIHTIGHGIGIVTAHIESWTKTFVHDVVAPIEHDIAELPHNIESWATSQLDTFNKDIVQPIGAEVAKLESQTAELAGMAWSDITAAIDLVIKCTWFLEKVAEYTLDDILAMPAEIQALMSFSGLATQAEGELPVLSALESQVDAFLRS